MSFPVYPKEMRDRAKREGKFNVTVDILNPDGKRYLAFQGPLNAPEAQIIANAWLAVMVILAKPSPKKNVNRPRGSKRKAKR